MCIFTFHNIPYIFNVYDLKLGSDHKNPGVTITNYATQPTGCASATLTALFNT